MDCAGPGALVRARNQADRCGSHLVLRRAGCRVVRLGSSPVRTGAWSSSPDRASTAFAPTAFAPTPRNGGRGTVAFRWEAFLDEVRERGEYDTPREAERAARVVLALLGAHLVGNVRAELAARLPETLALVLLNPLQAAEPLGPERFVRATAAWIEGATETTALWDIGAVLSTVADAAGDDLTERVLLQLPPGYDLLFGRPRPGHRP